jgi:hypothetical protein
VCVHLFIYFFPAAAPLSERGVQGEGQHASFTSFS